MVSLPLNGYFRVGKCMPVMIQQRQVPTQIRLSGENIVPVEVPAGWSGIVPVLVLAASASPVLVVEDTNGHIERMPLFLVDPDQRLIAIIGMAAPPSQEFFGGHALITIALSAWDPRLAQFPINTIDGVMFEDIAGISVSDLATGILAVISSEKREVMTGSWTRSGEHWVLHPNIAGPSSSVGVEEAYLPTQGWQPGVGSRLRHQILLVGALVAMAVCGSMLLRGRKLQFLAIIFVVAIGYVAIEFWRRGISPIDSVSGNIVVKSEGMLQEDHWQYIANGASESGRLSSSAMPILFDTNQAEKIDLKVLCQSDGRYEWSFKLPPKANLAFLSRRVILGDQLFSINANSSSPLRELARQGYLRPGMEIKGQFQIDGNEWGGVLIGH